MNPVSEFSSHSPLNGSAMGFIVLPGPPDAHRKAILEFRLCLSPGFWIPIFLPCHQRGMVLPFSHVRCSSAVGTPSNQVCTLCTPFCTRCADLGNNHPCHGWRWLKKISCLNHAQKGALVWQLGGLAFCFVRGCCWFFLTTNEWFALGQVISLF
jgi:hypothetical protein